VSRLTLIGHLDDLITLHPDLDLARDLLLRTQPLDHISRIKVHLNRIAIALHLMPKSLDLAECRLEPIPLSLVLLAALGDCERVCELGVILPELELGERRASSEQVEDGADDGSLVLAEVDPGSRLNVLGLDVQLAEGFGG